MCILINSEDNKILAFYRKVTSLSYSIIRVIIYTKKVKILQAVHSYDLESSQRMCLLKKQYFSHENDQQT
jgi:hypothetical protein